MDSFCPELLDITFSFLPLKDLCAAAQVCTAWKETAKLSIRRRISFEASYGAYRLHIKNLESYRPIELFWTSRYRQNNKWSESQLAELNRIHRLDVGHGMKVENEDYPGLALLAVSAITSEWCDKFKQVHFYRKVQIEDWSVVSGLMSQFPVLEELCFRNWVWFDPAVQNVDKYVETELELWINRKDKGSSLPPELELNCSLKTLKYSPPRVSKSLKSMLDAVMTMKPEWCEKITTLCIKDMAIEHLNVAGGSLLKKFPRLKHLKIKMKWLPQKYASEEGNGAETSASGTTDDVGYKRYGNLELLAEDKTVLESKVSETDFVGKLVIEAKKEDDGSILVFALSALKSEMCDKITELEFKGYVAIEDWNVLETSALGRFPNLKEIQIDNFGKFSARHELFFSVQPHGSEEVPKLQGTLTIPAKKDDSPGWKRWNEPLRAAVALNDQWSSTVTKLVYHDEVTVQDWNVVGKFVTDKYRSLKKLKVNLKWVPGYAAGVKIEGGQILPIWNTLDQDGSTNVDHKKFERTQSFLALKSMIADACTKITHLRLPNELAVQDWNVAGNHVLSKFHSLKELILHLVFVPDYVSTIETDNFPTDAVFKTVERLEITLNLEPSAARDPLTDIVTRCPNLKAANFCYENYGTCACRCGTNFFVQYSSDTSAIYIHAGKAHAFFGRGSDESDALLCSTSSDVSVAAGTALAPVVNSLPFTSLGFDQGYASSNLYFLKHLSPETAQRLTTFETQLSSECESASKQLQFLFTLLHRHGFTSLENLTLRGGAGGKSYDLECDAWEKLQLPTVKKLKLCLEALNNYDAMFFTNLTNVLPNVEELLASHDIGSDGNGVSREHLVRSGKFLKYTAAFKKLKVLEWEWEYAGIEDDPFDLDCLVKVEENLAKHDALESLKISVPDLSTEQTLESWKAVVRGCTAAPRMRVLQVVCYTWWRNGPLPLKLWFNQLENAGKSSGLRLEIVEGW